MKLLALFLILTSTAAVAVAIDRDAVQRSISSNEKMISRFQSQAPEGPEGVPGLQKKIEALESENARLRKLISPEPSVKPFEDLKGADWSRLSEAERQRFVYTAIGGLERRGILIMRSPDEYLEALDKVLQAEPMFKDEYLDNLFVFCVFDGEPQTRDAIRKIREEADGTAL